MKALFILALALVGALAGCDKIQSRPGDIWIIDAITNPYQFTVLSHLEGNEVDLFAGNISNGRWNIAYIDRVKIGLRGRLTIDRRRARHWEFRRAMLDSIRRGATK